MPIKAGDYDLVERLQVGTPVFVSLENRARYRTAVRGWRAGQHVLLDCPLHEGLPLALMKNEKCVVRFMAGGVACGFLAKVIGRASKENPCFQVSWPDELETIPVRKHERVEVSTACTIRGEDGSQWDGHLCDLSVGGCRLYSTRELAEASRVTVSFAVPRGPSVQDAEVLVRNANTLGQGAMYGCAFQGIEEAVKDDINLSVAIVLDQRRRPMNPGPDGAEPVQATRL